MQPPGERILALDIRPGRMGYFAVERSFGSLDWGIRLVNPVSLQKQIVELHSLLNPATILVYRVTVNSRRILRNGGNIRLLQRAIRDSRTKLVEIKENDVHAAFRRQGHTTKHERNIAVAGLFPELEWKMPPVRKLWQTEHWRAPIFDAAALLVAYRITADSIDLLGPANREFFRPPPNDVAI